MSLATLEAVAVTVELLDQFDLEFAPGWSVTKPQFRMMPRVRVKMWSMLTVPVSNCFLGWQVTERSKEQRVTTDQDAISYTSLQAISLTSNGTTHANQTPTSHRSYLEDVMNSSIKRDDRAFKDRKNGYQHYQPCLNFDNDSNADSNHV